MDVFGIRRQVLDYGDSLAPDEILCTALDLDSSELEKRQCVSLSVAASLLWSSSSPPSSPRVHALAQQLRTQLWDGGKHPFEALGPPASLISEQEHQIWDQIHDVLMPHHDKAYHVFSTFEVFELEDKILEVWRVNLWGHLCIDRLMVVLRVRHQRQCTGC